MTTPKKSEGWITGSYASSSEWIVPAEMALAPSFVGGHNVTMDKGEIFLDYFQLKGVVSMNVDRVVGQPLTMTLVLYVSDVEFHADEKK